MPPSVLPELGSTLVISGERERISYRVYVVVMVTRVSLKDVLSKLIVNRKLININLRTKVKVIIN